MNKIDLEPLHWHTEARIVKDLIAYNFNPRHLTEDKKQKLIESLAKFNLVEIPVINLDNVIIAGHQRFTVLVLTGRQDETIDVRVPNRMLTEMELKEYNLRSNISIGDWVDEILQEHFNEFNFDDLGLTLDTELEQIIEEETDNAEFKEEFNKMPSTAKYPLVPKFSEKYDCIIIVSDNKTDTAFIQTVLDLGKNESYKSERVGQTNVLTASQFQKLWEKK